MLGSDEPGARGWIVLGVVGVSNLLAALGNSSVVSVLPVIQDDLATDVATIGLALLAYQITSAGLMLTIGRLGDLRGHRTPFLLGIVLFALGSGACGLAPTVAVLIGARVVQAIGAAMLWSTSVALVAGALPMRLYGRIFGLMSLAVYLGLSAGPIIGGALTDTLGWRSVFLLNVPLGALLLVFALRFLPEEHQVARTGRFDLTGAVLFMLGLGTIIVGLDEGPSWGWTSPIGIVMAVCGIGLAAAFIRHELRVPSPMLDLGLFRGRAFSIATLTSVLNYIGVSAIGFLIPFYLIHGRGLAPAQAGLYLSVQPIAQVISAPLSGAISDRIGTRLPCTLGMAVFALSLWLLSLLGPQTPLIAVAGVVALAGLGTGAFSSPNNSALMSAAPRERRGTASGVQATARTVGFALGVSISAAAVTSHAGGATGSLAGSDALFPAISTGLLAAAVLAAVGTIVSSRRAG